MSEDKSNSNPYPNGFYAPPGDGGSLPKIFMHEGVLRIIGVPKGKFITIRQTHKGETYTISDTKPKAYWGTGVYIVREDGTLLCLEEDYDSSD